MPDPVEQPFMLYRVLIAFLFLILELLDGAESVHRPVSKLPRLRPSDIHVLGSNYHNYELNPVEADTCTQARTSGGRDARLYSIDAPLAEHEVRVVPLIGFSISIGVLLDSVELCADDFAEFLQLHSLRA